MKTTTRIISFCLLLSLAFFSCQKETQTSQTPEEQQEFAAATSESEAENEVIFNDVFDNVMGVNSEVAVGGTGVFGGANRYTGGEVISERVGTDTSTCYVITVTNLNSGSFFPARVVIDFGAGCTGKDGRIRKGKIITEYSSRLIFPGAIATTTFDGYYVNGIKVEGTHTIKNTSTPNTPSFEVKVAGKLSKANGNFSQWNSERTITMIEGQTTLTPFDDILTITGGASGSVKKGDKFYQWATHITEPLVKKFICRWIVKGTISLKRSNTQVAILDYGTGGCDNKATFSVGAFRLEISLH